MWSEVQRQGIYWIWERIGETGGRTLRENTQRVERPRKQAQLRRKRNWERCQISWEDVD